MTLGDLLEVVTNSIEREELTYEDVEDYEVEIALPEDMDKEGILSAMDVDINRKQQSLKVWIDLV